ncbi:MAG: nicotinate phosphoribosyltransferase [Spirochaetia bacterium]
MNPLLSFLHFLNSDRYQYTESSVFLKKKIHKQRAVFEYFFRRSEDGGYAVVSGTQDIVRLVDLFNHTCESEKRMYLSQVLDDQDLIDYLSQLQFNGNIYAMKEGEFAYPHEPIIVIEGELIATKIIETPLLNTMNYQMTIASKANRIRRAAGENTAIFAFNTRRAHGLDAAILGTKAALIGGCDSHSSLSAQYIFGAPAIGTMSHSYVQAFGLGAQGEYHAFDAFVNERKTQKANALILLIDTYDTINIGLDNAIECFKKNQIDDNYAGIYGIRIDSGDLAYLSKYCRKKLDEAGMKYARIVLTNSLDEHLLDTLIKQGACFDGVGIGDAIAVNRDNPCFGGVYKLAALNDEPVIKISEDIIKTSTPDTKQVYRIFQNNIATADLVCLRDKPDEDRDKLLNGDEITIFAEHNKFAKTTFAKGSYTVKALLVPMMIDGKMTQAISTKSYHISDAQKYRNENMHSMSDEHRRLTNPHFYKVDLSKSLYDLKATLLQRTKNDSAKT